MAITRVAILGAGTMGVGIAQLCLQRGFSVVLYDSVPEALCSAAGKIRQGLENAAAKNRITPEALELALKNGVYAKSLKEIESVDLVIEAVSENLEVKGALFKEISEILPTAILATNTSSLSVSSVAEFARFPERVLGIHFFNPPVATKLIEMVRTPKTGDLAYQAAWDFVKEGLGRTPIAVKNTPGFVVNRVMRPYYLESQRAVLCGAGISDLDLVAREIGGVPMGPFELMDLIGLDINLAITKTIYEALGRPERFKPQPIQEYLVSLGHHGRKSEKGFYLYKDGKRALENPEVAVAAPGLDDLPEEEAWDMIIQSVIEEAEMVLKEGVASREDIDLAITLAMNFPRGPLSWKNENA